MRNNDFLNIDGRGKLIDINVIKQNIEKQIENGDVDNYEENAQEISLSKFKFTHDLVVNMRTKRKELNLTQSQLSQLANVNRTTISKIESFQRFIVNIDVILRLLDALGLELSITDK